MKFFFSRCSSSCQDYMIVPVIPEQILSKIPNLASSRLQIERVFFNGRNKKKKEVGYTYF
jgi:hypothetical protein